MPGEVPVALVQFGIGPYELLQEIDQHNEQAAECPYCPEGLPDIDQPELLGCLMVKTTAQGKPGSPLLKVIYIGTLAPASSRGGGVSGF